MTTPIPSPPTVPFLGYAASIDKEVPLNSFNLLAKQYGEIYELNMFGRKLIIISSQNLVNEVSDEKRFRKMISPWVWEVRSAIGDALFTADVPKENNWYIAHRILMPAFSTLNVHNMFDDMVDIVSQMVLKWERFGAERKVDPAVDFSALTLDAISLCAMSYRLNSFYMEGMHPFVQAMSDYLAESGRRANRLGIVTTLMRGTAAQYEENQRIMMSYVDAILEDRKANPIEKKDILSMMLEGKDKETGEGLSEDGIKRNLLTFLIAGHETTSGMLSFAIYYLLKNPEAMRKLREEVDTMIGQRPMTVQDVHKLPYLIAVLRETLRLAPTAPLRSITPLEDTIVGGKYAVAKDTTITCEIFMAHRDPKVWGEDADEFRPERMLDGKFEAMPNNAWQPFGYGMRGCIGRPFAWQEAQITLVLVMQRFDITLDDPSYELQIKQTLTIKPLHFYIHASPRKGAPKLLATPSSTLLQPRESSEPGEPVKRRSPVGSASKKPIYVLYGSNTGSSEAFAQRIAAGAASHGFRGTIGTMDSAMEHVPTDGPVIVVTASFEGQPADNAAHFVTWLTSLKGKELDNVTFGVFGCGNHDWVATYQRIPTLCDQLFAERGAKRIIERGEGDAGSGDFFESFDKWEAKLWETLTKEFGTSFDNSAGGIEVQTVDSGSGRAVALRQNDATLGTVVENRVLTSSGVPAKRHIEFDLPEGATYRAGDYLAILPVNPSRDVQRAMARFGLSPEQEVSLSSTGPTSLPIGRNISVFALLSGYVELSQPATTRDLHILSEAKNSETSAGVLKTLASDYSGNVLSKRLSLLDILEDNRDIELSFGQFLQILPSMRVRQYSISSSPLYNPQRVSLTISVLEAPAISGRSEPFLGVASTYLAGLRAGDKVTIAVRASNAAFHPPTDPTIPLVMFCAGSGLAPMRGFLQERAMQKLSGREVAKSLLFLGCRSPTQDYLYSDSDLKEWAELGVVELKPAFSRASEESLGCKYVQDRLWHDKSEIVDAYKAGGKFFTCGAGKMAVCVKERLLELFQEHANLDASGAAERFAAEITNGRFAMDIFE